MRHGDAKFPSALHQIGSSPAPPARETFLMRSLMQCLSTLVQRLPGHASAALTAVALVDDLQTNTCRVFSAGLAGQLEEWDAAHAQLVGSSDSYGGAIWRMETQPASGTQAGERLHKSQRACGSSCHHTVQVLKPRLLACRHTAAAGGRVRRRLREVV